jgi:hypothetical protein
VLVLADIGFEIPIVRFAKLYVYYGHTQPLFNAKWFPLPDWYITTNMFFVLLPALLVLAVMASGRRGVEWTIPFVMVAACYMCYGSVTWPVVAAMQNGLGTLDTTLAALVTMALGCFATYIACQLAPKLHHAMDWYGRSGEGRPHQVDRDHQRGDAGAEREQAGEQLDLDLVRHR